MCFISLPFLKSHLKIIIMPDFLRDSLVNANDEFGTPKPGTTVYYDEVLDEYLIIYDSIVNTFFSHETAKAFWDTL